MHLFLLLEGGFLFFTINSFPGPNVVSPVKSNLVNAIQDLACQVGNIMFYYSS